jgi:hypothetical protein
MDGRWTREILEWYLEDVKESKVVRVKDGLMNWEECVDADCSRQTGMEENWRGLHPAVDGERIKMICIQYKSNIIKKIAKIVRLHGRRGKRKKFNILIRWHLKEKKEGEKKNRSQRGSCEYCFKVFTVDSRIFLFEGKMKGGRKEGKGKRGCWKIGGKLHHVDDLIK